MGVWCVGGVLCVMCAVRCGMKFGVVCSVLCWMVDFQRKYFVGIISSIHKVGYCRLEGFNE